VSYKSPDAYGYVTIKDVLNLHHTKTDAHSSCRPSLKMILEYIKIVYVLTRHKINKRKVFLYGKYKTRPYFAVQ